MKGTLILGVVLLASALFIWFQYRGAWREPPSTELHLSENELRWKHSIEGKMNGKFTDIALDNSFMEDSVIYMYLKCDENSHLQTLPMDSLKEIARFASMSFFSNSDDRRNQTCIQITFTNIFYRESSKKLKYPVVKRFLYLSRSKEIKEFR